MNAKNNCDIPERGHSKESVTRHSPSHLGMDLTGRWIVTMGIVTMLVSELQLLIGYQLVLGPGCSTAINRCWSPAAARQSVGVGTRLQHGNQLVLGPRTALVHYANHNVAVDDRFYVALFSALKETLRSCLM